MGIKGLLKTFDNSVKFWKANPLLTKIEPFKDLYKKDRSFDKHESSTMLWFIAICYDQSSDNTLRNIPTEERLILMGNDLYEDEEFYNRNKLKLEPYIEAYLALCETPAMKALRLWNNKMLERAKFINDTKYTLENAKELDVIMVNTPKLFNDYQRILKDLSEEEDIDSVRGGGEQSLKDKRQI